MAWRHTRLANESMSGRTLPRPAQQRNRSLRHSDRAQPDPGNRVAVARAEVHMRNLVRATLAVVIALSTGLAAAGNINPAFFGTWKLNTANSKAGAGETAKGQTVTLAPRGDSFIV